MRWTCLWCDISVSRSKVDIIHLHFAASRFGTPGMKWNMVKGVLEHQMQSKITSIVVIILMGNYCKHVQLHSVNTVKILWKYHFFRRWFDPFTASPIASRHISWAIITPMEIKKPFEKTTYRNEHYWRIKRPCKTVLFYMHESLFLKGSEILRRNLMEKTGSHQMIWEQANVHIRINTVQC